MWRYSQKTGELFLDDIHIATGYSGHGDSKNHPADEALHNRGPIPRGDYTILAPRDTVEHGPCVLPLRPDSENKMYGRGGFLIHGDSIKAPGTASLGCIILSRVIRQRIWDSDDHELTVVEKHELVTETL